MTEEESGPVVVPVMFPCITCGIAVQAGDGPGDLAWHDCEAVKELRAAAVPLPPAGIDPLFERITQVVAQKSDKASLRELAEIVDSLARYVQATRAGGGGEGGGISRELHALLEGG